MGVVCSKTFRTVAVAVGSVGMPSGSPGILKLPRASTTFPPLAKSTKEALVFFSSAKEAHASSFRVSSPSSFDR